MEFREKLEELLITDAITDPSSTTVHARIKNGVLQTNYDDPMEWLDTR